VPLKFGFFFSIFLGGLIDFSMILLK
jgi:hypothetical protein